MKFARSLSRSAALIALVIQLWTAPAAADPVPPACPGSTFETFLQAFTESADVQRNFTTVPFTFEFIDADADPEPRPVTRRAPAADVRFPLMPDKAFQTRRNLKSTIRVMPGGAREVMLAQPDTDYQMRFLFNKTATCWTLTKKSDDSL